ncbi:MAG: ABC-2 type transport system permease protein [Acidimicrobiales bacterium]|jgi:ABC-2 type transport system permease protein
MTATDSSLPVGTGGANGAQIFDQGYRRYEGVRTGFTGALRSLVVHSMRHALGLGRSARFKVIPIAVIIFAYLPAVAFVGLAALLPEDLVAEGVLPTYASYYGYVVGAIYLFAAFVAPLLLCTDRRTSLLGVYLASPLNRPTYLLGKAIATVLLLLIVTFGPPMLMLIAFSLESAGPSGFFNWIEVFIKILFSSLTMGLMYSALALAVAAATDRWVFATAAVILLLPGSAIVTDVLVWEADLTPMLHLLNLPNLPRELIFRIHGEANQSFSSPSGTGSLWRQSENSTASLWLAWIGYLGVSIAFIWYRYRRLLVRR